MRDPELVARAGYAAARLEQAWERWRALHGLGGGSADPLASYVGYSLKEPMGQPRVVIGVDAAEAEFFADFLESQAASAPGADGGQASDGAPAADVRPAPGVGLAAEARPLNGSYPSASGSYPSANGSYPSASGSYPSASGSYPPVNGNHPPVNGHPVNGAVHPPISGPSLPPVSGPQRTMPAGPTWTPAPLAGPLGAGPAVSGPPGPGPAGPGLAGPDLTAPGHPDAAASLNGGPGGAPAPRDVPSEPMVRLVDGPEPGARPAPLPDPAPLSAPVGVDRSGAAPPAPVGPATSAFPALGTELPPYPGLSEPMPESADAIAAEMAGWSSGELPGQASEQLASWAAGESGPRRLRRSRSAR